jgi:outer membrane immunogenic protein
LPHALNFMGILHGQPVFDQTDAVNLISILQIGDATCAPLVDCSNRVGIRDRASAADLPRKAPAYTPPPLPPAFTWTGCYIGGHLGGGWGDKTVSVPSLLPGVSVTGDLDGFLGGGQVGCNLQFGGNWVIGIEGEGSAADIKGDITRTIVGITGTASAKTNWIASATGRLGWAWDRWLIYGKGGAA